MATASSTTMRWLGRLEVELRIGTARGASPWIDGHCGCVTGEGGGAEREQARSQDCPSHRSQPSGRSAFSVMPLSVLFEEWKNVLESTSHPAGALGASARTSVGKRSSKRSAISELACTTSGVSRQRLAQSAQAQQFCRVTCLS